MDTVALDVIQWHQKYLMITVLAGASNGRGRGSHEDDDDDDDAAASIEQAVIAARPRPLDPATQWGQLTPYVGEIRVVHDAVSFPTYLKRNIVKF